MIRTPGSPADLAPAVREALRAIDRTMPVAAMRPMDDVMESTSFVAALDSMEQFHRDTRAADPGTHHLLIGLLATSPEIAMVFAAQNIDSGRLREEIRRISG